MFIRKPCKKVYIFIRRYYQKKFFQINLRKMQNSQNHSEYKKIFEKHLEFSSAGKRSCKRIEKIFEIMSSNFGLSPEYIAQLRYDKSSEEQFDIICNKAMHLFTTMPNPFY